MKDSLITIETSEKAPVNEAWKYWTQPEHIIKQKEGWKAILENFKKYTETKH